MQRITIVGLGLIGTSIGLGLKQAGLDHIEIVGTDMESSASGRARRKGAVDKVSHNLVSSIEGSGLVIIAVPVMAIKEVMELIGPHLGEGCVVTDTGSTKVSVLEWAREHLPSEVNFVGGHPMAGKEESGPDAAEATLFQDAAYCIVPGQGASSQSVKSVVGLAELLGATPFFIDAKEHDSFAAAASHLPMILSTILVTATTNGPAWDEIAKLVGTGYKDISRLASGDPEMSRDICLTNPDEIVHWLDEYMKHVYDFRNRVKEGKGESIIEVFIEAWEARAKWLAGVPKRKDPIRSEPTPSLADSASTFLLGDRLAAKRREMIERNKRDPLKYFRKRHKR